MYTSLAVGAVLLAAACGGGADLLLLPGDGEPASIRVENDEQSGRVGEPLADSLSFVVNDSRTQPVEGARIVFDLNSAPGAEVVPDTAETDANGRASVRMVLGTTIGAQTGVARVVVPDGAVAPTTNFTVMALPENASGIVALSGDVQSAPAGSTLPLPLVVRVTDAFGNPIAGVPISWAAEGGGSVSEASNQTDGDGRASVLRTLGPIAGTQTTVATSANLAGSPVIFTHTAIAGSAAGLSIVSGNEQTAQVGTELPGDLVVRLVDAAGNGVPNAAVTWVVGTGGGSVSPQNTTTDEAGRTSSRWTLGPTPGENRVDAVVSGVGVVHFTATGTAARPAGLVIVTQPPSSTRNGEALSRQPVVQVRDGAGTPVAGVVVTAQLSGGGGELLGTRQLASDANGRVAYTDLAIAGAEGPRRLVFTAAGFAGATSDLITVRAIPTTTAITSDSPDPSVAGTTVTITVRVTAERVVPIGTVTITDGSQTCTATLSGGSGSCQLSLSTVGTRTLRATYAGSAGLSGSSDTEGHLVTPAATPNNPPHADYHWHCEGFSCAFTDASSDSDGSVVSWNWNFGDGGTSIQREPTHVYGAPGEYLVSLTVTDNDGASDQATAHVTVTAPPPPPNNKEPHAEFEVHCDFMTCTFEDRSRDEDGTIVNRSWNYGDGSAPSSVPSHTYSTPGKYQVTLTVTDDRGATDSKEHDAEPTAPPAPNQAPTAAFTSSCTNLSCSFNSDASSDSDGEIRAFSWDFGDGTHESRPNPQHTYGSANTYSVTLVVTDDDGAQSAPVTHQVTVTNPPPENKAPQADFEISCTDLTCNFQDKSKDDDGTIVSRFWDYGDGSSGSEPSHTYAAEGTYPVTLTVTDDDGATGTKTRDAQPKEPEDQAPAAQDDEATTNPGTPVAISVLANDSDPDGDALSITSVSPPGHGTAQNNGNGTITYTPGSGFSNDTDVFSYTVSDGSLSDQATVTVTVNAAAAANQAPTARIGSIICTGMHCEYTDDSTDPDGADTIASYAWLFGDGEGSSEKNPSHNYASVGDYPVTLTVTDDHSESDDASLTISVPNGRSTGGTGSLIAKGPPS